MNSPSPPPSPETPTLAEQIAWIRKRLEAQEAHVKAGLDGGDNVPELNIRRAILTSLQDLASLQSRLAEAEAKAAKLDGEANELAQLNNMLLNRIASLESDLAAASVDGDKGEGK